MFTNQPFNLAQINSINRFQRDADVFTKLSCQKCAGPVYASEEGLICKKCFNVNQEVPTFIASGSWELFGVKVEDPDENEDELEDDENGEY